MENVYTISVHGIGPTHSHYILQTRLNNNYNVSHLVFIYDYTKLTLKTAARKLDRFIHTCVPNDKKVILIGHSAGGRIVLHAKNPQIIGFITIASPLAGSRFLKIFKPIAVWMYGKLIGELAEPHSQTIEKPLVTITAAFLLNFDGRMFESSMHHPSEIATYKLERCLHSSAAQVCSEKTIEYITHAISNILKK